MNKVDHNTQITLKYAIEFQSVLIHMDDFPKDFTLQSLKTMVSWFNQNVYRKHKTKTLLKDFVQSYRLFCQSQNDIPLGRKSFSRLLTICLYELEQMEKKNECAWYKTIDRQEIHANQEDVGNPFAKHPPDATMVGEAGSCQTPVSPNPPIGGVPPPMGAGVSFRGKSGSLGGVTDELNQIVKKYADKLEYYKKRRMDRGIFFENCSV